MKLPPANIRAIVCDELARLPRCVGAAAFQVDECRRWPKTHKHARLLGLRAVAMFRRDTGIKGRVYEKKFRDWFRQWLKDHAAQINFARLIVSVISLLVIL